MKKIFVLKLLVFLNIIIGIKFLIEYVNQLNYTFNADGLRLIIFVWPVSFIYVILSIYLIRIHGKIYAFLSFINGIAYFLGVINTPKHIPSNFLLIAGVSILSWFFLLTRELKE